MKALLGTRFEYYFWRALYIAIKPLALLVSAELNDVDITNTLALAILISGTLMASLSMGSYRRLFVYSSSPLKYAFANNVRKAIFKFNTLILFLTALLLSFFFPITGTIFIVLFVITEHVIHDESRILLYEGNRVGWAKNNCLRSLFILAIPLFIYLIDHESSVIITMIMLFGLNVIYSVFRDGLFNATRESFSLLRRKLFYKRYKQNFNYFVSGTTNRLIQQSDKFLFSIISYELLWVYTLLCQIFNVPLVMFEMVFMSELKTRVAKLKIHYFTWLNFIQVRALTAVTIFSAILYLVVSYLTKELVSQDFIIMAFIICCANYLSAASMQNSEKLFWYLGDAVKYRKLEMRALLLGHLVFVPVVLLVGSHVLVKLPNIVSILVKLRNSKKWLAS